ncbi:MAG: copper ABC transporter substrate-binding protein, partial [Aliifodinibius sp.]|nr:copper ABC transporter substrate-binding protein [Fodinibius sp.]
NTLVFNNKGILIEDSLNNHICGNNITEEDKRTNRIGVHLINSSGNNISENSIEKCYKNGIELWKSSNNTISGNTINQNNNTGVDLYDSSGNNISENRKITENAGHG